MSAFEQQRIKSLSPEENAEMKEEKSPSEGGYARFSQPSRNKATRLFSVEHPEKIGTKGTGSKAKTGL
jgi:hypothetical protein